MLKCPSMLKGLGKRLIVLALFCIVSPVLQASLAGRINSVVNGSSQKKVEFGIKVLDPTTGKTLYSHNSRTPMIPASNMKVVASAAALQRLGPDYKFTTRVGMLGNTLVVIGGGDPLFGDESTDARYGRKPGWVFDDIIAGIKALGITALDGIVIDSTFFDDNRVPETWPRDQLNRYYACETSGLNYNGNCVRINVKRSGSSVLVTLDPATHYVKIVNQVKTSSRTNAVGAYRNSLPNKLIVKGYCKTQAGFDVAIERPAPFFGFILAERLNAAGIEVRGDFATQQIGRERNASGVERCTPTQGLLVVAVGQTGDLAGHRPCAGIRIVAISGGRHEPAVQAAGRTLVGRAEGHGSIHLVAVRPERDGRCERIGETDQRTVVEEGADIARVGSLRETRRAHALRMCLQAPRVALQPLRRSTQLVFGRIDLDQALDHHPHRRRKPPAFGP